MTNKQIYYIDLGPINTKQIMSTLVQQLLHPRELQLLEHL